MSAIKRKSLGHQVFALHSWAGLISGVFIMIFALTGAIIVFSHEINQWQFADFYKSSISTSGEISQPDYDAAYLSIRKNYPDVRVFGIRHPPIDPLEPLEFAVSVPKSSSEKYRAIFVDQHSGVILGVDKNRIASVFLSLHYKFMMGKPGEFLATLFSLALLVSIITGAIVYKKFIWKALLFRVPVKWKNWRTASSDLHRILGVWALVFNFILAFSGFWMMRHTLAPSFWKEKKEGVQTEITTISTSINQIIEKHREQFQTIPLTYITIPSSAKDSTITVSGDEQGRWWLGGAFEATYSSHTGNLNEVFYEAEVTSVADNMEYALNTLHFGQYGGIVIKLLMCFFGIATAAISITGFMLWWRRNRGRVTEKVQYVNPVPSRIMVRRVSFPSSVLGDTKTEK